MEGVEVLKGAASLRFGPNTIGGVINYKTKEPTQGVSVSARVGSHYYKEANASGWGSCTKLLMGKWIKPRLERNMDSNL